MASDATVVPPVPDLQRVQHGESMAVFTFATEATSGFGLRPDADGVADAFARTLEKSRLFRSVARVEREIGPAAMPSSADCQGNDLALIGVVTRLDSSTDGLPFLPSYGYGTLLATARVIRCADREIVAEIPDLHARFEAGATLPPGLKAGATKYAAVELVNRLEQALSGRTVASAPGPSMQGTSSSATPPRTATGPISFLSPRPEDYSPFYGRKVAAVIGINDYQHWPDLEGARPDAREIAVTLRALGFNEVLELYDGAATRRGILELLGQRLQSRTSKEDLAVIFFAGHGQTESLPNGQKRGYIIPADADDVDVFSTAISMEELRDLSNRLPAKHVYYAMDSCYSGLGFVRGVGLPKQEVGYLGKITARRAVQMITAGSEGEEAIEIGGRGLFTTKLIDALHGAADINGDGAVTSSEIGAYVGPQVSAGSRDRQIPQFGTLEGNGEVVFVFGARPPSK